MTKNRKTLKGYFTRGAIPTEANFADLIDSMLNQDDDNIGKLPKDPLRITASGEDENLLNFYRMEQGAETLTWRIKQKPSGKPGLSIGDAADSRLFIESGTGKVGIGTTSPGAKLQVVGGAIMPSEGNSESAGLLFPPDPGGGGCDRAWMRYYIRSGEAMTLEIGTSNDDDDHIALMPSGNVGIGTTSPVSKLHIHGDYQNTGTGGFALDASDTSNPETYILRINPFVGGGGQVGYQFQTKSLDGGTNVPLTFDHAGNVGIGTTAPTGKLDIAGDIRAGNSDIYFTKTDHNHTGIGNSEGFAAIENAKDYEALMILGRTKVTTFRIPQSTILGSVTQRRVRLWDYLQVNGPLEVTGNLTVSGSKSGYIVDRFINGLDDAVEEGDVIVISGNQVNEYYGVRDNIPVPEIDLTQIAYDRRACGIVCEIHSEMNTAEQANTKVGAGQVGTMVTLGAFAHCKVDADIAPIQAGDLLTTSPSKGHAQKVLDPSQAIGAIIGKALGSMNKGKGKIPVLVMLQ